MKYIKSFESINNSESYEEVDSNYQPYKYDSFTDSEISKIASIDYCQRC